MIVLQKYILLFWDIFHILQSIQLVFKLQLLGVLFTYNSQLSNELLNSIVFQEGQFFIDFIFKLKLTGKIDSKNQEVIFIGVVNLFQFFTDIFLAGSHEFTSRFCINVQSFLNTSIFQISSFILVCQFFICTANIVHLTAAVASWVDISNSEPFLFNLVAFVQIVHCSRVSFTFVIRLYWFSFEE